MRSAAIIHAPKLLPPSSNGTVHRGLVSIADWWATLATVAGLDASTDSGFLPPGTNVTALPSPWGCAENHVCHFDIDSINILEALSPRGSAFDHHVATPGRKELLLGIFSGGALLRSDDNGTLWKYVVGNQYPDFWYGPHSPNCTDSTGGHGDEINCADGCLFELRSDSSEHVNRRDGHPGVFSAMQKRFNQLKASVKPKHPDTDALTASFGA